MPMRDASINARLVIGFVLVLLMTVAIGAFAILRINQLSKLTEQLYDHPFIVSTEALQARIAFARIERSLADLIYNTRPEQQEETVRKIAGLDADIFRRVSLIRERYLGPPADVVRIERALAEWRGYRDLILDLSRARKLDQIENSLNGPGREYAQSVEREIDVVIYFALNRARAFEAQSRRERGDVIIHLTVLLAILVLLGAVLSVLITRGIVRPLDSLRHAMLNLADGKLDTPIPNTIGASEVRAMAVAVSGFKESLQRLSAQSWVKSRLAELTAVMQRAETPRDFAESLIRVLVPLVGGGAGLFHVRQEEGGRFLPLGGYGIGEKAASFATIRQGEGLVGQCARQRMSIILTDIPEDYCHIASGLGGAKPRTIQLVPVFARGEVFAVIEIASFSPFTAAEQSLIDAVVPVAALTLEVLERNISTKELLEETRQQAEELRASQEELQIQSEELASINEELKIKSDHLINQAETLRSSETELQAANEALIEKGRALEVARRESEHRAGELGEASRYKSEFLANMSHELRTPLNSLLILSRGLADNEKGNLSSDQIESARIIHESGSHLLDLINDILDLSKVEAGKMDVCEDEVHPVEIASAIRRCFASMVDEKGLGLTVEIDPDLPDSFYADGGKIEQIITNLVSNAIKFTHQGGVCVRLHRLAPELDDRNDSNDRIAIEVSDTGIGVPADKLEDIFHAFEQADGTTSRQYGGTGLGLSICRRLAELIGATIHVESVEGQGSTFTLNMPLIAMPKAASPSIVATEDPLTPPAIPDDRDALEAGDQVILVIEDDDSVSLVLCDLARSRGFKCVRSGDGIEGLGLARRLLPTGILLDIGLPGLDGWSVMTALKHDSLTRAIPVHFISANNDHVRGLRMGAAGFLTKPVDRDRLNEVFDRLSHLPAEAKRRVLIVDDDSVSSGATASLVQDGTVEIREASTGAAALDLLRTEQFDCLVLDLILPDISGFDLLDRARADGLRLPPVVIHSAKDLSYDETLRLRDYTDSIVIKSARSPERLLDEVTLFLHSVRAVPPIEQPPRREEDLAGRKILLVDDDMRNAFALSKTLRNRGLSVLVAEDGIKAVAHVDLHPDLDMVLMDIMMPGMDGYTAIAEIRRRPGRAGLPILALTAKAMPGDRERCLAAGANDHVPKPIDIDRLLELIRHWLRPREDEGT
ncbi:response regulator [Magnetospirillum molischianum]|uniref:histidine kinase n=1 Tax=Magnetospirillum molischianum DSM 120 TaxID=1150626 RepID=H8FRG9_MAGML|nr:response regulator [Magnetospirillum molischianum]CCG40957.1 Putative two-component sensor histidine kinase, hybrid system [Magnetospirillum molischianum DSM 120]